jgi:hypothetical protein
VGDKGETIMEPQGKGKRSAMKAGLVAAGLLLGLAPTSASAQGCTVMTLNGPVQVHASVRGVFLEAIEHVNFVATDDGGVAREAPAIEVGTLDRPCGTFVATNGNSVVMTGTFRSHARSSTPVTVVDPSSPATWALGVGDTAGTMQIRPDSGGVNLLKGSFTSVLDFTPTNVAPPDGSLGSMIRCPGLDGALGPCPWVFVTTPGSWETTGKTVVQGMFVGVALVPVEVVPGQWFYVDDMFGSLSGRPYSMVPLTQQELTPQPSAKFVVTLFQ